MQERQMNHCTGQMGKPCTCGDWHAPPAERDMTVEIFFALALWFLALVLWRVL
jgi:hypothetical protein